MDAFRHARRRIGGHLRAGVRRDGRRARAVAALAAPAVVAFPGPGWQYASPNTHITFSGADAAALGTVTVEGSVSGPHSGTIRAVRRGPGAIFAPSVPFEPGEQVTVRTQATEFSFTVARKARPPFPKLDLTATWRLAPRRGSPPIGACRPRRPRLRTRPDLRPAGWCTVRRATERAADGHLLVTPRSRPERRRGDQHGVMILSRSGQLLWYSPRPHVARDLKTVFYRGERLLAFYQHAPGGRSHYVLLDRRYRPVMRIRPAYRYRTDTHELRLTRRGTAYVGAYQPVWNAVLGRLVTDYVIQELDLQTGDVLFEWHSLDHVPPSASYEPPPRERYAWDYFHGNSIEPPHADGTLVVSARNTSAVYGIDRRTGALRWTLGGKLDEFGLAPAERFCAQHDARPGPGGTLTLFDNGGAALGTMRDCPVHPARVQRFRLDVPARRARLVRTIRSRGDDGSRLYVWAMGSAQRQANDNLLIGWGTTGRITEVTPRDEVVYGLQLDYYSYRAVRSRWTGIPTGRPSIAARRGRRLTRVWASWNGATEVARWRLLAGQSRGALGRAGSARFVGLETLIRLRRRAPYVAVEALDRAGSVLGRSATVRTG